VKNTLWLISILLLFVSAVTSQTLSVPADVVPKVRSQAQMTYVHTQTPDNEEYAAAVVSNGLGVFRMVNNRGGKFSLPLAVTLLPTADKQVIPVKLVNGMVFVPVNVNGSDVLLMLDTGATNTVISPAAVHVPVFPGSQTTTVTEGHQEVAVAVAPLDVRVGKARFDSSVVVLTDLAAAQRTRYGKFDGLLGQSILSQFRYVCLDYQNKVIELEK
jgi:hypothetical protein